MSKPQLLTDSKRRAAMRERVGLFIGVLLSALALACSGSEEAPPSVLAETLRDTAQGPVMGFQSSDGAHVWRGIPFAKPPVGGLRWRAPRAPEGWLETREAVSFGESCPQFAPTSGEGDGKTVGLEDCLTLNIYAPAWSAGEVPELDRRLPVMLWIHGGGNSFGDAQLYEGSLLALSGPVIVVTIQYRLGVMGWFTHPSLRRGQNLEDDSGNYGTLDVIRALEWVQQNISNFGGDPGRVLVFGESAGGSDTHAMLLSPRARGLFHRAISQSGSARMTSRALAENDADDPGEPGAPYSSGELLLWLLIEDGLAADRESARQRRDEMSPDELADYLRNQSVEKLMAFYRGFGFGPMYATPQLIQDGHVLPELSAVEAYAKGRFNRVPAIFGTNRDETKLFMLMGDERVRRLAGIPLWRKDPALYDSSAQYTTQNWKLRGADEPARGVRAHQKEIWVYRFDWDEERSLFGYDLPGLLGAGHAMEIPFVFGWLSLGPATRLVFDPDNADTDRALSDAMMSYWTQFAYSGDPGRGRSGEAVAWPAWSNAKGGPKMLVLDTTNDGGIRPSPESVTFEGIVANSRLDPRLAKRRDWCEMMLFLTGGGPEFDAAEYARSTGEDCSEYPVEGFPWES